MRLHPDLRKPAVLAYVAALLAWRDGDEVPTRPPDMVLTVEQLMAQLQDRGIRRELAMRLSVLIPHPDRKLRRRR